MKKLFLLALLVMIAINLVGCGGTSTPTPLPAATVSVVKVSGRVVAEGKVVPVKSAALSFQTSGTVAQIPVSTGDSVEAGKVLMSLDTRQLDLQLAQAEANLAAAQAKYNQVKRGPTVDDSNAAQQAVKSAQAVYDSLLHPPQNDLIAAKSDVDKAKAQADRAQAAYDRIGGDSNPIANMTAERAALQSAWLDYQKAVALYNSKDRKSVV
jgi:HlyD family secretion protein